MCDEKCATGVHRQLECPVFARKRVKLQISNIGIDGVTYHPFYQSITPLRCLMLKRDDPVKWNSLKVKPTTTLLLVSVSCYRG